MVLLDIPLGQRVRAFSVEYYNQGRWHAIDPGEETTTIGVRRCPLWRTCLDREKVELETAYGALVAKVVTLPDGERRAYPEHDSVERLANAARVSYQHAWRAAMAACEGYGAH